MNYTDTRRFASMYQLQHCANLKVDLFILQKLANVLPWNQSHEYEDYCYAE